MDANVPEKLYLFEGEPILANRSKKLLGADIEYTRTDAFIEKAAEYLLDYEFNDSPTIADRRKRVEEFKKYMKGE